MKKIKNVLLLGLVSILFFSSVLTVSAVVTPPGWESELIAGQDWDNPVGNLEITHDEGSRYLYITYTTTGGWKLISTHLAVAESLSGIPQTKSGNPKVGKFPYKNPAVSEPTMVQYVIDLNKFKDIKDNDYTGTLYIAAHAVVQKIIGYDCCCNPIYKTETAWADSISFAFPGNNWARYIIIEL